MINRKIQLQFLLVLLAGALVLSFFILKSFLAPLALAVVFAVVLRPSYLRMSRSFGGREGIAAFFTVLVAVIGVLLPLSFLGGQIFDEARGLYESLVAGGPTRLVERFAEAASELSPRAGEFLSGVSNELDIYARRTLEWLIDHLGRALSGIGGLLLDLFIFFIALYYLLRDGLKLKQSIIKLSPLENEDDEMIFGRLELAVNSVVKGNLTIALIQGALTAVGLTLFGIPNAALWGAVAAVAALLPGIGTSLVLAPAIIYLFVIDRTGAAFGLMAWAVVAVGLIDNVLGPRLIGGRVKLHPMFILLSVLGGLAFFGPVGVFLGPLTLSLLFAFLTIYSYLAGRMLDGAGKAS